MNTAAVHHNVGKLLDVPVGATSGPASTLLNQLLLKALGTSSITTESTGTKQQGCLHMQRVYNRRYSLLEMRFFLDRPL